jgi:hypothetical protein
MNKGFVILAIDTDQDMMKYAYTAAMSIKLSDPEASICLVVDKNVKLPKVYSTVFDFVTELPFGNSAYKDGFHGMNIWQMLHATPYAETIYIDFDTIFINVDVNLLWDTFSKNEIGIPGYARTYRNQPLRSANSLFEYESHYNLPKLYNSMIYFKRDSELAISWFKMADAVLQNWRDVYNGLMSEKKPPTFSKNLLCNIVTHLLDVENEVKVNINNLYDLDIKSQWLWNNDVPEDWTEVLNHWFPENKKLIIENSVISTGIVHYRDLNFITEEVLNEYRTQIDISGRRKTAS